MKKHITRVLVWVFAAAMLGSFSLTPRLTFGLNAGDSANSQYADEVAAQNAYNDAYNQAFDDAYADQVDRNNSSGGSGDMAQSCGGGGE